ncbi:glycosyltransferase family 2 protein [Candidatus Methylopumilus universalis]|uniref:glycosyltransferase n=1 Tax=Candidatus Methylopumilus universalis TaxID=2588536 RepID=UPI0011233752|nr:glycosyltransferase family A protein [Candidatus Methylopumilus universalis]QDC99120.1 glycosyltransferase family 2 protein [Candidatus Methylopumilus universalis]
MKNPKISVIVPVFNSEKYIGRCIRSILNNKINPELFEIIIINDASTDNTKKILEKYSESIELIEHDNNLGLPAALNAGILKAKGQFIVRVDSDDYVHEDYLYILMIHLQLNNDIDAFACDYLLIDDLQNVSERKRHEEFPIGCGIMYRADKLIDIGLYDTNFLFREDEDLRIRFKHKYRIGYVSLPLYKYHIHGMNMTLKKEKMEKFTELLIEKHKSK